MGPPFSLAILFYELHLFTSFHRFNCNFVTKILDFRNTNAKKALLFFVFKRIWELFIMKKIVLYSVLFISLTSLAACQTTSSDEHAALSDITPASGQEMSCTDINQRIAKLDTIIAEADNAATTDHAVNGAGSIALQGAAMSGAGASIPFLGTALNVAGGATKMNAEQVKRRAERAETVRAQLVGLRLGKNCPALPETL